MSPAAIAGVAKGIDAAGQMLQWRVTVLESDLAKSPADKANADNAAEAILLKLRASRPDLAQIIDEQLVKRMPANKAIDDKMPISLLLALMKKGMVESYKSDAEGPSVPVMEKGIEAAQAIRHRKDQKTVAASELDDAALSIPILLERIGKKLEAANAFLDYATEFQQSNPSKAAGAFERSGYLVFEMRKLGAKAPEGFADLYNRFLPIAILKFNHRDLAYAYAEQLRNLKNFKEALKFYRMVPKDNPAWANAQYKQMLVLGDQLYSKQDPAEHKQTAADLAKVATEVRKLGDHPKDNFDRAKAVQASLMLANLYRVEEKNPQGR